MAVKIAEQLNLSFSHCLEMFTTVDDIIVNKSRPTPTIQDTNHQSYAAFHRLNALS